MQLRTITSADDMRQVFLLEQEIWGYTVVEDSVPVPILLVSSRIGGLIVGAFDEGRLVGFAYALPGIRDGKPFQWSHMLGVLPRYRNTGLGLRLKLEQRRQVMASGLDLIRWTYDPLQALNAHFNFAKLGAVAGEYHLDAYPASSSTLHLGTPTDRLVAEWWLRSDRVVERLGEGGRNAAGRQEPGASAPTPVNAVHDGGEWLAPAGHDVTIDGPRLAVTIPAGFTEMQQRDLPLAQAWRAATREVFTAYLPRGYTVVDFVLDRARGRGSYVLARG